MPLYRITKENKIETIKRIPFGKEKPLQNLVEKNIESFFGLVFLETEYAIPNGRIDSLCIDESGVPVVIEYKKKKDLSAIIQGLFYVDWLRNNKSTFEMIVRGKLAKSTNVDWRTAPRLLIIAEEFDQKEATSINQINASVELIKYSFYGDLISFEQINIPKTNTNISFTTQEQLKTSKDDEMLSLDSVLEKGSDKIRAIILKLRDYIFEMSDEIDERVKSSMISYYSNNKGMIWIHPSSNRLIIHLRKGKYDNKYQLIKYDGWGGYPELHVGAEQFDDQTEKYVKSIILQAYNN
jgi:hypothetical protein